MNWNLEEAISYYRTQGAPGDQSVLIRLLREVQHEKGGAIPTFAIGMIAREYGIKEGILRALIKRIPSLRLGQGHCLELCGGQLIMGISDEIASTGDIERVVHVRDMVDEYNSHIVE